ncbi:flavoprotein subunit-like protein, partial [Strigomonas culicis]
MCFCFILYLGKKKCFSILSLSLSLSLLHQLFKRTFKQLPSPLPLPTMTDLDATAGGNRVIVIGGGLAGVCAAHSALQHGASVLLLDKSAFLGGNSTKASSGIAGTPTQAQISAGVLDGVELFIKDTNRSFHGVNATTTVGAAADTAALPVSPLVAEMARLSGPSLDWLVKYFNCDLSVLGFMGGHSQPRTHRGKAKMPGMAITYALINALEAEQKKNADRARIVTRARVVRLIRDSADAAAPVTGVVYADKDGKQHVARGAVVIATGGYAADFADASGPSTTSLIARFTPQLSRFATTNGAHATGDGIKMAEQVGAGLVDMQYVQVHPSGLVDPKDPGNHIKFLCAEATRGAGGIVVDQHGERFVDELGRRDQVSHAMLQRQARAPFYLVLNEQSAKEMDHHCKHYEGRGLMTRYPSITAFCEAAKVPREALARTLQQYQRDAVANAASRGGSGGRGFFAGLFGGGRKAPAAAAAATLNNKGTPDAYGKTLFRNAAHFDMGRPVYVAQIAPVVHYTMGGIRVNAKTEVLGAAAEKEERIPGLYCAGEAAGGVHGKNRLGGNSLLDCVVYGRVAGTEAARYLLDTYLGPFSSHRLNVIYTQLQLEELPAVPPVPTTDVAALEAATKAADATPAAPTPAAVAAPAAAAA